jgi:glycosyltransferase 2 family protein
MRYARILGSVVLLSILAWRLDLSLVGGVLARARWGWWLAAFACYAAAQMVSAWRWQVLASPLGFRLPVGRYLALYLIGSFFNLLLPTSVGGDVVRAWYLDAGSGRRWPAFLSVLADRLSGLFVLATVAFLASLAMPLPPWVRLLAIGSGTGALVGLLVFLIAPEPRPAGFSICDFGFSIDNNIPGLQSGKSPKSQIQNRKSKIPDRARLAIQAALCYRRSPRVLLLVTAFSVVIQAANVVVVWLLGIALGVQVPAGYYFVAVPLATLVTLVPVSVGGMGVREGGMALLLAPLGVPVEQAVTLALLWFSVFLAAGLVGAGCHLCSRFDPLRDQNDEEPEPVGDHPDQGRAGQPRAAA